jgi:hypothetical protein
MCVWAFSEVHTGQLDFFGPENGPCYRTCRLMVQRGLGAPLKSLNFVTEPFRILEMAPLSDFQGLIS